MNRIDFGDCRETLAKWKEEGIKVQMCVTSPPYFGLRSYGTETWEGGDETCDHATGNQVGDSKNPNAIRVGVRPGSDNSHCKKCGAIRIDKQIGLEQTPEEYISNMVEVFRGVRDILADDGTLWINIGDSYIGTGNKGDFVDPKNPHGRNGQAIAVNNKVDGLRRKNLIGIPWKLAFALQEDGWILRQDIIWAKGVSGEACDAGWHGNPMPESVADRCTKSHEYIFLLSKNEKYFYDADSVKEPAVGGNGGITKKLHNESAQGKHGATSTFNNGWDGSETRNMRSVWTISTKPYKGSHFAVFPEALIVPTILAGTSKSGHCPKCGDRSHTCKCGIEYVPDVVFDPFMGSGTTAATALSLGRNYAGCELNLDYKQLQDKRIHDALNGKSFVATKMPEIAHSHNSLEELFSD